ncbi:MAG: GNAT family N-acetyltransferase [Steroidobacteraceae bacterium]|nr:GNAT family N-acetyltransferase [Nevskiaceae bacterium]MCP5340021.1 GNAT family N-acetyltransferase [Nevskiaceae bacterium]MCP5359245.1 GNAT family N-acetyltransferase [Nevskiaceae bacterium]MCP5466478.1 GNAT family N-acetyltransferase [Nevskiaceae bacterium]MCP5471819.1 GNAT family N-acetyltransferase [Nevskiaceae bacterium]
MLEIRPARPADTASILTLIRELAEYEKLLDDVDADPEMIDRALFAPQPRVFCDIAEWTEPAKGPEPDPASGTPVIAGFALWFYNFSTFRGRHGIYLEDLFVRPEYRGHGIGGALLAQLAHRCVEQQLTRLEWAVLDWNEPALQFYRSLGAVGLDDWTLHRVTGAALTALAARASSDR